MKQDIMKAGANQELSTNYAISPITGIIDTAENVTAMQYKPHLSRDGGKGGWLNCQNIFVFADTGSYSPSGQFNGFVSSSVAVDVGLNGADNKALRLQDPIGEWSDDAGRQRGFVPLTEAELAYNLAMQGNGHRVALWPESSLIPYDESHSLMYVPIVYDHHPHNGHATFTYVGTTLIKVHVSEAGPVAERIAPMLFTSKEVEWGGIGGIRSYGTSGPGGKDGKVYIFGNGIGGLLLARVDYGKITDRSAVSTYSTQNLFHRLTVS